jgi:hypothetical protein
MNGIEPVTFLNLDLELDSKSDLSPLAEFIGSKNYVLFNGKVPRGYHLCVEPLIRKTLNGDIRKCTDHFLKLLEKMPPELFAVWRSCKTRTFDYGFDGGAESPPLTVSLSSAQLLRIAQLGLEIRLTIYSHRSEAPIDVEQ